MSATTDWSDWKARFAEAWRHFELGRGGQRQDSRQFAKALGWPESTLSEIARLEKPPKGDNRILDLSRVSGLHPGWLHYNVEPKYLPEPLQSAEDAPPATRKTKGRYRKAGEKKKPGEKAG